jgi:hypothetical protein
VRQPGETMSHCHPKTYHANMSNSLKRHHLAQWNAGNPPKKVKALQARIANLEKTIYKYHGRIAEIRSFYETPTPHEP